jgi:stage II sporulation protein AA (anti-sigma F factor antagonist)
MPLLSRRSGDTFIFEIDGRLAVGGPVDDLRAKWMDALTDDSIRNIVLNLEKVTMVDSSGIGTIIRCHSAIARNGGTVKIVGASHSVREAFKITRLDKVFEFHESEQSALS